MQKKFPVFFLSFFLYLFEQGNRFVCDLYKVSAFPSAPKFAFLSLWKVHAKRKLVCVCVFVSSPQSYLIELANVFNFFCK